MKDFTVLGDVVNTAAPLQAEAAPGELIMTEETYAHVSGQFPDAGRHLLSLKGKTEPVPARSVKLW